MLALHPGMRILFTSGYSDDTVARHGVADHGARFIGKPYSIPDLKTKVSAVLDEQP
jgi:hypothetical protein